MANTSQDLNNSLGSTLKAGADEMGRSFAGVFAGGGSNDKSFNPKQITAADVANEKKEHDKREVKILV